MENNYGSYDSSVNEKVEVRQAVISKTFIFMFAALLISSVCAVATFHSDLTYQLLTNRTLLYVLLFGEIGIVMIAGQTLRKQAVIPSAILLIAYAAINGVTLSYIFVLYEIGSIFSIFLIAALTFGVMAVYGYVTKSDLTRLGSIGIMGLFGVIIMSVVNIFLGNGTLDLILSMVGLALFIGLTAYDMQKIKAMADSSEGQSTTAIAMLGALEIYLDFVNIFLRLLRLFGKRK